MAAVVKGRGAMRGEIWVDLDPQGAEVVVVTTASHGGSPEKGTRRERMRG